MSYSHILEGLGIGALLALIPGLHPMIIGSMAPLQLGAAYGAFTGMGILLARKGIYHPETSGEGPFRYGDIVKGLLLGGILLPVAVVLYAVKVPLWLMFIILLAGSTPLLRYPLTFFLSGLLGFVVLKLPVVVKFPLASGLFYLFGAYYLMGREIGEYEDWKRGVLASFLTGYFPGLPSSAWTRMIGGGSIAVSAVLTPIFSLVSLIYGRTRAAMTSFIPYPDPWVLFVVGLSYLLGLVIILSLGYLISFEKLALPKEVGLAIMVLHALYMGMGNVLLLLVSLSLVYLLRRSAPASLFGFIVVPTLTYYA